MPTRRPRPVAPFLVLVPLVAAGCDLPRFHGPQIQSPPPAFTMNPEADQQRRIFPELQPIHHDAWVEASGGNFSGIYIDGYRGVLTTEQIEGARQAAIAAYEPHVEVTELEPLRIDGRAAWGWTELWRPPGRGLVWVAYRAVIPYDTISYAVEFIAGDPGLKVRPDSLRTIVASFAVGRTQWNFPLIAIVAGAVLFLVAFVRKKREEAAQRARSITLKKIPKPEKPEAAAAVGGPEEGSRGPGSTG